MDKRVKIDISITSILKIIAVLILSYLLFLTRDILALLFVTIIIVSALSPVIEYLEKHLKYRSLAVILVFVAIILLIAGIIYAIIPPLVIQSKQLAQNMPAYINRFEPVYNTAKDYIPNLQQSLDKVSSGLAQASGNIFAATAGIFGGIISFVTVIVLSFYLLVDKKAFRESFFSLMPINKKDDVSEIVRKIASKVGDWLRGQMLLGLIVGIIDLIGLLIIGVPFALTLALISAMLEIVPVMGPIIAGGLAAIIALTTSPLKALLVVILYVVVQQLENNILVPQIMKKAVGLSPVVIIVAIATGFKLYGVTGALLALPIAGVAMVIAQDWNIVKRIFSEPK